MDLINQGKIFNLIAPAIKHTIMSILNKLIPFLFIIPITSSAQDDDFKNYWLRIDSTIVITFVKSENFLQVEMDTTKHSIYYTKINKVYFAAINNHLEHGTSQYIIQDNNYLAFFLTSPYLHYPNKPIDILSDLYSVDIIDIQKRKDVYLGFPLTTSSIPKTYKTIYIRENSNCLKSSDDDFIKIDRTMFSHQIDPNQLKFLKRISDKTLKKKLVYESIPCPVGVGYWDDIGF